MKKSIVQIAFTLLLLLMISEIHAAQLNVPIEDMTVICEGEQDNHCRILFNVDISQLGSVHIDHAEIVALPGSRLTVPTDITFYLFPITQQWNPSSVDWGSPWDEPGGDVDSSMVSIFALLEGMETHLRSDVTSIVRSWVNNPAQNYGLLVSRPLGEGGSFGSETQFAQSLVSQAFCRVFYTQIVEPGPEPAITKPETKRKVEYRMMR
jgi:hypothetical protein